MEEKKVERAQANDAINKAKAEMAAKEAEMAAKAKENRAAEPRSLLPWRQSRTFNVEASPVEDTFKIDVDNADVNNGGLHVDPTFINEVGAP